MGGVVGASVGTDGKTSEGVSAVIMVTSGGGVTSGGKYACQTKIPAIISRAIPIRFKIRARKSFIRCQSLVASHG